MANVGSGYGGGGAGGGEQSSDNFTGSSAGAGGFVAIMTITIAKENVYKTAGWTHNFGIQVNPNFKVKVGSNIYTPFNLVRPAYETGTTKWSVSKMTLDSGLSASKTKGTRSYQVGARYGNDDNTVSKKALKIGAIGDYSYYEFADLTGYRSNIKLASSKVTKDGVPLKLLYTSDGSAITQFIQSVTTKTLTAGQTYSAQISPNQIICIILQAGGGGGGGADNSWGLFNYAAGGGGGGAGGAGFVVIKSSQYMHNDSYWSYSITQVGSGGGGGSSGNGSRPGGSSGGNTVLRVYYGGSSTTEYRDYTAYGGSGGGGANGDSAGGGGSGGGFSESAGTATTKYKLTSTTFGAVTGGNGGKVGNGGTASGSGAFGYTVDDDLVPGTSSTYGEPHVDVNQSIGSAGTTGSQNDRGGGGGGSWLGNGGYY